MNASAGSTNESQEPIAIVGIGCRFPGGCNDWQSYWQMLSAGRDVVSQTPADRWSLNKFYWPDEVLPGKTQSQWGGYVDAIDQFDPQLFGISPREASSMDPQQRMLLEVAWRALEDAGHPVEKVAGKSVAVFTGISSFDYAVASLSFQDRGVIGPYNNTGGSSSIAANRLSYCFDLRGPSVAVDTACSSSLVAVHMACESITHGECEMALVGGVNALLLPDFYVAFSQLGVLSPDGRCKTFDSRANGYVRAEGAGMVLLKPLSRALHDGDHIYAMIRSTALNQDGRTQGMTVPSQAAQERLLRTACRRANIDPCDIQYVEAHGTGTPVGDPIEANALATVLGEDRKANDPCWIGSVKTNIGHLEAGAGIASLIKVALSLHHKQIPAHLHFEKPNPQIDFEKLKLRLPLQQERWEGNAGQRLAGINGFGYGGANAHVIVQEAPTAADLPGQFDQDASTQFSAATSLRGSLTGYGADRDEEKAPILLPISARSKAGLSQVAQHFADWLDHRDPSVSLEQIAGYAAFRRSHQQVRATVSGSTAEQWTEQLREIVDTPENATHARLSPSQIDKGVIFVFSGQGPQWWGMGRELYRVNEVFRDSIQQCDREFAKYVSWSLIDELHRPERQSRMHKTSIAQPCIFALQIALAAVWDSWGIRPNAIVGHSVGEIAGACLSGALTWQDACCVAIHRGRTMDIASSNGAMIAVGLSPEETKQWTSGLEDQVSLAAINGPTSVTISGADHVIESLAEKFEAANVFCRRLKVEYAFHSPQMEPVREELLRSLAGIRPRETRHKLISTVTGQSISGRQVHAEYWWDNVRQSVRFADAMEVAAEDGFGLALEIGPHPVLAFAITECFQQHGTSVRVLPSLHREREDNLCMSESLGGLYRAGIDLDWSKIAKRPSERVMLPVYPFQYQRCWDESFESASTRSNDDSHPLLGDSRPAPQPTWSSRIDLKLQSFLRDHCVRDACMLPAAAMIEVAGTAANQIQSAESVTLRDIKLQGACVLDVDRPLSLQTTYQTDRRMLQLAVRDVDDDSTWRPLMSAKISTDTQSEIFDPSAIVAARSECVQPFTSADCYEYCEEVGLQYGQRFRLIQDGVRRVGEVVARVTLDPSLEQEASQYTIHPALLDGCFHGMVVADPNYNETVDGLFLPAELREVRVIKPVGAAATVHVRLVKKTRYRIVADIDILDAAGEPAILLRGFVSLRVGTVDTRPEVHDLIYRYVWTESDPASPDEDAATTLDASDIAAPSSSDAKINDAAEISLADRKYCIFVDQMGIGQKVNESLTEGGGEIVLVQRGSAFRQISSNSFVVDPENRDNFIRLLESIGSDAPITDLIYLWALDAPDNNELDPKCLDQSTILTTLAPLHLVAAWDHFDEVSKARLTLVTLAGQSSDDQVESVEVSQTPLIGFGRVIVSEFSRLETKLVDLPSADQDAAATLLTAEVVSKHDGEDEIMYREGKRWVHRFVEQYDQRVSNDAAQRLPSRLQIGRSTGVSSLQHRTVAEPSLKPDEVEIEVLATGLNFSDVMKALDLYPGLPDGPVRLGAECSGRVTRVGSNVTRQKPGDLVIAVAEGSFATHATVKSALVAPKPANLTHHQAAAIPIAFLTAQYALHECARMRAGDRVLIHSASGGVGLAAMQLAKIAGAQIFATAGNDEKRQHVRELGAAHVMDSRQLAFAEETLKATDGAGVDIILNSLPGEAITRGLSILRLGGRFLEIGKRDIYSDAPLGLNPFRNNLSLFAIDLDQLFKQQPERMGQMLEELVGKFDAGELQPLPVRAFDADEVQAAFRYMQQGKHIGKVVVDYQRRPADVLPGVYDGIRFRSDATYWIAGGLGGFGLQIARWMAEHGAGNLVLSGRRKQPSIDAAESIEEIRALGTTVTVLPTDITQATDVRATLAKIDSDLPELRGIFHTAMVLEDKLLVDLDRDTLERVLRPKILGGWNLHHETKNRTLDHFVLFSSLSSVFGHAGQANYSAANAMLDGLAHFRRANGLVATVMNWGYLGEAGYLAERQELGERLERQGVLSFSVQQATESLEYALQTRALQLSVLRMDWSLWRGLGITSQVSPRFAHLLKNQSGVSTGKVAFASAEEIRAASAADRCELIRNMVASKVGMLLGIDGGEIEPNRPLLELGLDSLMAVELRNWIESQIEVNLPISALMRSTGLADLTSVVSDTFSGESDPAEIPQQATKPQESISAEQADTLLNELPELADDQVTKLLGEMLRQQEGG